MAALGFHFWYLLCKSRCTQYILIEMANKRDIEPKSPLHNPHPYIPVLFPLPAESYLCKEERTPSLLLHNIPHFASTKNFPQRGVPACTKKHTCVCINIWKKKWQTISPIRLEFRISIPDSMVHMAYMGPTWVLAAPGGPYDGPMNLAIRYVPVLSEDVHYLHHLGINPFAC